MTANTELIKKYFIIDFIDDRSIIGLSLIHGGPKCGYPKN